MSLTPNTSPERIAEIRKILTGTSTSIAWAKVARDLLAGLDESRRETANARAAFHGLKTANGTALGALEAARAALRTLVEAKTLKDSADTDGWPSEAVRERYHYLKAEGWAAARAIVGAQETPRDRHEGSTTP